MKKSNREYRKPNTELMNLTFKETTFGSEEHKETIQLRDKILRFPLGMKLLEEDLAKEDKDIHLAVYSKDQLIACLVLHITGEHKIKMRQVAVDDEWQGKGIGYKMVLESERTSRERGMKLMYCHARDVARKFYEKLGYKVIGEHFFEVGIKHWFMQKEL